MVIFFFYHNIAFNEYFALCVWIFSALLASFALALICISIANPIKRRLSRCCASNPAEALRDTPQPERDPLLHGDTILNYDGDNDELQMRNEAPRLTDKADDYDDKSALLPSTFVLYQIFAYFAVAFSIIAVLADIPFVVLPSCRSAFFHFFFPAIADPGLQLDAEYNYGATLGVMKSVFLPPPADNVTAHLSEQYYNHNTLFSLHVSLASCLLLILFNSNLVQIQKATHHLTSWRTKGSNIIVVLFVVVAATDATRIFVSLWEIDLIGVTDSAKEANVTVEYQAYYLYYSHELYYFFFVLDVCAILSRLLWVLVGHIGGTPLSSSRTSPQCTGAASESDMSVLQWLFVRNAKLLAIIGWVWKNEKHLRKTIKGSKHPLDERDNIEVTNKSHLILSHPESSEQLFVERVLPSLFLGKQDSTAEAKYNKEKKHSIWKLICRICGWKYVGFIFVKLCIEICTLSVPVLLQVLIDTLSSTNNDSTLNDDTVIVSHCVVYVALLVMLSGLGAFLKAHYTLGMQALTVRLRQVLSAHILWKNGGAVGVDNGGILCDGGELSYDFYYYPDEPQAHSDEAIEVNHVNSASRKNQGEVITYLTVDVENVVGQLPNANDIWSLPLEAITALFLLYQNVSRKHHKVADAVNTTTSNVNSSGTTGTASSNGGHDNYGAFITGLALCVVLIPVNFQIAKKIATIMTYLMEANDERVRRLTEVLEQMKQVIMCGGRFVKFFKDWVHQPREEQYFKQLIIVKALDACCVFFWVTTPVFVSLGTFAAYYSSIPSSSTAASLTTTTQLNLRASTDSHVRSSFITAGQAVATLAILQLLIIPLNAYPWVLGGMSGAYISMGRLGKYLFSSAIIDAPSLVQQPAGVNGDAPKTVPFLNTEKELEVKKTRRHRVAAAAENAVCDTVKKDADRRDYIFYIDNTIFSHEPLQLQDLYKNRNPAGVFSLHVGSTLMRRWSGAESCPPTGSLPMPSNNTAGTADVSQRAQAAPVYVRPGEIIVVVGGPGAGKSTLLLSLLNSAGNMSPPAGEANKRAIRGSFGGETYFYHCQDSKVSSDSRGTVLSDDGDVVTQAAGTGSVAAEFGQVDPNLPCFVPPTQNNTSTKAFVGQSPFLLGGSVRDNILLFGTNDADVDASNYHDGLLGPLVEYIEQHLGELFHPASMRASNRSPKPDSESKVKDLFDRYRDSLWASALFEDLIAKMSDGAIDERSELDRKSVGEGGAGGGGTSSSQLSGGQRVRLALARAFFSNSDLYLLDDPLSAVDPPVARYLVVNYIQRLARSGKAVVVATHRPEFFFSSRDSAADDNSNFSEIDTANPVFDRMYKIVPFYHGTDTHTRSKDKPADVLFNIASATEEGKKSEICSQSRVELVHPAEYSVYCRVDSSHDNQMMPPEFGQEARCKADEKRAAANSIVSNTLVPTDDEDGHTFEDADFDSEGDDDDDDREVSIVRASRRIKKKPVLDYLGSGGVNSIPLLIVILLSCAAMQFVRNFIDIYIARSVAHLAEEQRLSLMHAQDTSKSIDVSHSVHLRAHRSTVDSSYFSLNKFFFPTSSQLVVMNTTALNSPFNLKSEYLSFVFHLTYLTVAITLLAIMRSALFAHGALRAARRIHDATFEKVMAATYTFFSTTPAGQIINRLSNDVYCIDTTLPFQVNILLAQTMQLLGCLGVIVFNSSSPILVGLSMIPAAVAYYRYQGPYRSATRAVKRLETVAKTPLIECVSLRAGEGGLILRTGPAGTRRFFFERKTYEAIDHYAACDWTLCSLQAWFNLRLSLIAVSVTAIVGTVAVFMRMNLNTTASSSNSSTEVKETATIAAGIGLALAYVSPLASNMASVLGSLTESEKALVSLERLYQYKSTLRNDDEEDAFESGDKPTREISTSYKGNRVIFDSGVIDMQHTSMKYIANKKEMKKSNSEKIVPRNGVASHLALDNVTVTFGRPGGERIAVVGRTGAGKSSLIAALLRLRPLHAHEMNQNGTSRKGKISIDDIDISSIEHRVLRDSIAVVPQDPLLFHGSLRENVDVFGEHSDAEVEAVLRSVGLLSSDAEMRSSDNAALHKLHTVRSIGIDIGDKGGSLSAGQRALVMLARVLLQHGTGVATKVCLLDESAASIDNETASKLEALVQEHFHQGTLLSVTHKLDHLTERFDRVVVLDHGRIVEDGPPSVLLNDDSSVLHSMVYQRS